MPLQTEPVIQPGFYPGNGQANLLRCNQQAYLLLNQANSVGKTSIAVQLERIRASFYPFGASLEISFSGAPGAFEIDFQEADTDQDGAFVSNASKITSVNSSNFGRLDLTTIWCKYARVLVSSLTNPVSISALITR